MVNDLQKEDQINKQKQQSNSINRSQQQSQNNLQNLNIDENGNSEAMRYALKGQIPPEQYQHMQSLQNHQGRTVAMILAENKIIPPKQWQHHPQLRDKNSNTVALLLAKNGIVPPIQWYHGTNIRNKERKTVEDYLMQNKIEVPQLWQYNYKQKIQKDVQQSNDTKQQQKEDYNNPKKDDQGNTNAIVQASKGWIPDTEYQHNPNIQNKKGRTVAMYLAKNNKDISKEWIHKPQLQDKNGQTVAMLLVQNKRVPPKEWIHDPQIKDKFGKTVAMYFAMRGRIPPKEWQHDKNLKDIHGKTVEDYLLRNRIQVPQYWQIKQVQQQQLVQQTINKSRKRTTDGKLPDNFQQRRFQGYGLQATCPNYYPQDKQKEQYEKQQQEQQKQKETSVITGGNIQQRYQQGMGYASELDIYPKVQPQLAIIPIQSALEESSSSFIDDMKQYQRNFSFSQLSEKSDDIVEPNTYDKSNTIGQQDQSTQISTNGLHYLQSTGLLQPSMISQLYNEDYVSQALLWAKLGYIPIKKDNHNPQIKNKDDQTVEQLLYLNQLPIPNHWITDQNKPRNNEYFEQAIYNEKIDQINFDPSYQNADGFTIAMIQALYRKLPEKRFYHDPKIQNRYGQTVKSILEWNQIEVPNEWNY